ncbi:hypothetical protein BBOV_II007080 [Babesia bovis T2Bo]|uniref:hypothetical protein n=1 Tax=Babesia bovis T2Bo TaxID=484906 RepID=UPI001C3546FE|nr:hypothetical protein BBOV_II007080 [Babesia bovis T2Bo]EDO06658.2 hypothetical protein BBOV_II007080 [Babesia bovis T2Bo]
MVVARNVQLARRAATRSVLKLKQTYYHRLWYALTARKWDEFERLQREMKIRNINHDEVTYTLKAHQCILNPHVSSMSSYMVIEEMKRALVHPAVIRMNEQLINSYFELEELKCQPPAPLWQNFAKATWQTSLRLNRQRIQKLKQRLQQMDPEDVLKLGQEDMAELAHDEFLQDAFSATLAMDEIHDEPIAISQEISHEEDSHRSQQLEQLERDADAQMLTEEEAFTELDMEYDSELELETDLEYLYLRKTRENELND